MAYAAPFVAGNRPVVLHPSWRLVARNQSAFVISSRYLLLGNQPPAPAYPVTLIDDQTGSRTQLTPPDQRCSVVQSGMVDPYTFNGFGGPWLMVACSGLYISAQTVELYSLAAKAWRTIDYSQREQAVCGGSFSETSCYILPVAVGAHWLEFAIFRQPSSCRDTCLSGYGFENIDTGRWRETNPPAPVPYGQIPSHFTLQGLSATRRLDLNSSSLSSPVCRPLRLPHNGTLDQSFSENAAGQAVSPILLFGQLAVLGDPDAPAGHLYMQQCGSRKRSHPSAVPLAGSGKVVLWEGAPQLGQFLPSMKPFEIRSLPRGVDAGTVGEFYLSVKHLYARSSRDGNIWATALPKPPKNRTHH